MDDVFRAARMASFMDAGDLSAALAAYRERPLRGATQRQKHVLDLHDLQPEEAKLQGCVLFIRYIYIYMFEYVYIYIYIYRHVFFFIS